MNSSHPDLPLELETLVRAAGDYMRPSDDLRMRVLESARIEDAEQRTAGRLRQLLLVLVLVMLLLCYRRSDSPRKPIGVTPDIPAARMQNADNPTWDTVEAFDAVRRRQAVLWQSAL